MSEWHLKIVVDPIKCDGRGVCHELFPEWISLDKWGFPIISEGDIPAEFFDHAQRAVNECPRLALHLLERMETRR